MSIHCSRECVMLGLVTTITTKGTNQHIKQSNRSGGNKSTIMYQENKQCSGGVEIGDTHPRADMGVLLSLSCMHKHLNKVSHLLKLAPFSNPATPTVPLCQTSTYVA